MKLTSEKKIDMSGGRHAPIFEKSQLHCWQYYGSDGEFMKLLYFLIIHPYFVTEFQWIPEKQKNIY